MLMILELLLNFLDVKLVRIDTMVEALFPG